MARNRFFSTGAGPPVDLVSPGRTAVAMTRISSKLTVFYKWGFPLFWFGMLAFFIMSSLIEPGEDSKLAFLIVPALMIVFGFFLFRKLVWDLADEVMDGGDYLLVRNRGAEERVPLSNVMNVSASTYINPPRVALRLVTPGRLGQEIVFMPTRRFTLNPFAKCVVAEDLMVRVDKARRSNRAG